MANIEHEVENSQWFKHFLTACDEVYLVGGAVRDFFHANGDRSKDLDFVVEGLTLEEIVHLLSSFGTAKLNKSGEDFDLVLFVDDEEGMSFDISVPRGDSIEADLKERDFSLNAMAWDCKNSVLIDPLNGLQDLKDGILKHCNVETFVKDPIRILRGINIKSRKNFVIEYDETLALMNISANKLMNCSIERITGEFEKWILLGDINNGMGTFLLLGLDEILFQTSLDYVEIDSNLGLVETFIKWFKGSGKLDQLPRVLDFLKVAKSDIRNVEGFIRLLDIEVTMKSPYENRLIVLEAVQILRDKDIMRRCFIDFLSVTTQYFLEHTVNFYPITINEVDISGTTLMEMGIVGKEIGDTKKLLLDKILTQELYNDNETLIEFLNTSKTK